MSPATIKMHHAILSAALHQAVKWDLVSKAATDNSTPPKVVRYRATAPDVEVVRALVAKANETNPMLSAAIMLAALTGCRRGELCGLRWSDVDRVRRILRVCRSVKLEAASNQVLVGLRPLNGPAQGGMPFSRSPSFHRYAVDRGRG